MRVDLDKLAIELWEANNQWGEPNKAEALVAWNVVIDHILNILDPMPIIYHDDIEKLKLNPKDEDLD